MSDQTAETARPASPVGRILKRWRDLRGLSQLDLALAANTSSRHLSFVETGRAGAFDRVVVAACDPATQLARIMARDGLPAAAARRRIAAQLPIADKAARADLVVATGGSFVQTERQVEAVCRALGAGT